MNKLVSAIMVFVFFFALIPQAYASPYAFQNPQELIAPMAEGDKAPFDGILFSTAAAAKIQVKAEQAQERCEIRVTAEVAKTEAKYQLEIANLKASKESFETMLEERKKIWDADKKFLVKTIEKENKRAGFGALYFAGGVLSGVILMSLSAYAFRQING